MAVPNPNSLRNTVYQTPWQMLLPKLATFNLNDPKTQFEVTYWRGYWDQAWFAQFYFPDHFRLSFSRMHTELFDLLKGGATDRGRRIVVAAPRGHAKTTVMLTHQVLHAICYGYEPFIVIMAQNRRESEARVQQILDQLRHNQRIIDIFGNLAPPPGLGGQNQFVARNGCMVKAVSWGQSIRGMNHNGHRPTLIIVDDVETLEQVQNPEQREKFIERFQKDVLQAGDVTNILNVTVIGTCLHDEGLISHLLAHPGWTTRKYQAVESFATNQNLWEEWAQIRSDLTNPKRETDAINYFEVNREEMLAGTQVLWPEGEPYERLMEIRLFEGNAAFQSEKQNEPYDATRQLFDPTSFCYAQWDELTRTLFVPSQNRKVSLPDLHTIEAFWDPALGESSTGDFAAIVVGGKDIHGYVYILDAYIAREKPEKQLQAAEDLYKKWKFQTLRIESNHFQSLLALDAQKRFRELGDHCRVLKATNSTNKSMRIGSLEPTIGNNTLIFRQDIEPLLLEQLKYFPTATHDDGPDALAGVVEALLTRRGPNEPLERRKLGPRPQIHPSHS